MIADTGNNRIVIIDEMERIIEEIDYCLVNGKQTHFRFPRWCGYCGDNICVVDSGNNRVVLLDKSHRCIKELKTNLGILNRPHWVAVGNNKIYVSDFMNHRICELDN